MRESLIEEFVAPDAELMGVEEASPDEAVAGLTKAIRWLGLGEWVVEGAHQPACDYDVGRLLSALT